MKKLSEECRLVYASPNGKDMSCYSPHILPLKSGRLLVSMDISDRSEGAKYCRELGLETWQEKKGARFSGMLFVSDDDGARWQYIRSFPFIQARSFCDGNRIYLLGHANDLCIMYSDDDGESWSGVFHLTEGEKWHQAPCNVWYDGGYVYLVMERKVYDDVRGWDVNILAPVLMKGKLGTDLTQRENWVFADEKTFRDTVDVARLNYIPCPFFPMDNYKPIDAAPGRPMAPMGWLETNVVKINDVKHLWYGGDKRVFHLISRLHSGSTNFAALLRVTDYGDHMVTETQKAPSGKDMTIIPLPGGQMKFHILFDEKTKTYWLLSTQATDSLTRAECLPPERFGLPDNERRRLQLHFSRNCYDWCFAGMVDIGDSEFESRHYAAMAIKNEDLCIVSRSGGPDSKNPHDTDRITYHIVKNFRELIY